MPPHRTSGTIDDSTEPEPDFAVVPREIALRVQDTHPASADLVLEVVNSSLSYDRNEKSQSLCPGRVPEYGILNLRKRSLELHRQPVQDRELPSRVVLGPDDDFEPLLGRGRKRSPHDI